MWLIKNEHTLIGIVICLVGIILISIWGYVTFRSQFKNQPLPEKITTLQETIAPEEMKFGQLINATSSKAAYGYLGGPTTLTWAHTGTGSTLLVVGCGIWQDVAGTGTITSATYNSLAMTVASSTTSIATQMHVEIWYKISPSTGSNNISITVTGATDDIKCIASTFDGTDTTSPLDAIARDYTTSGTGSTVNITTTANGEYIFDLLNTYGGTAPTQSQTMLYASTTDSTLVGMSYFDQTAMGLKAMTWSWTTAGDYTHLAVSFKKVAGGTATLKGTVIIFE